jgi:hypothetical protein
MNNGIILIGGAIGLFFLFREQIEAALSPAVNVPTQPATTPVLPSSSGTPASSPPPSWAVGDWYWVQGSGRSMSIAANGTVTLLNQGRTSAGVFRNGVLTLDGNNSTVTQNGSGIRTVNQSTGEISDYSRTPTANVPLPAPNSGSMPTLPQFPSGGGGGGGIGGSPMRTGGNCLLGPCEPEYPEWPPVY